MYGLCLYQINSCQPPTLMQLEIFSAGPFYNRPFLILSAASHRSPGPVRCQLESNTDDNISPPSWPLWLITSINFSHRIQCRRMLTIIFIVFYNVTVELVPQFKSFDSEPWMLNFFFQEMFYPFETETTHSLMLTSRW